MTVDTLVAIAAAYVLALPLGWERKQQGDVHVGLRTLPLVAVGTCAYLLLGRFLVERGVFQADGLARTLRSMMTGIGFIGGGAILKQATNVKGVSTAASVWATGAVAAAVAYGHYTIAVTLSLASVLVVHASGWLGKRQEHEQPRRE